MIARTTIGSTIGSALAYGAGELGERSRQQKAEKVDLLATYNLSAQPGDTPKQAHGEIADEMKAVVRDHPGRCQNPVWHTSLSLRPGETLDVAAWTKAVDIYLRTVGIDTAQHQVAVFRHRDTAHDHIHIYANRIAMDGGAAVKTGWNYKANVKATRQIEEELNLTPLTKESKRTSLKDHIPEKQMAREVVAKALKIVLHRDKPTNLDELVSDLEKHRITAKIHSNSQGPNGVSFQAEGHQSVKGTSVGYKFKQLSVLLEANRAEYQAEIEQLRQERDKAEKARESEEKARQQAEQARDQALNQPAKVEIREIVKPDLADQKQIAELKQQLEKTEAGRSENYDIATSNYKVAIQYKGENERLKREKEEAVKRAEIAEKAREQAVIERDGAQNKPPTVIIKEIIKEVVMPDPRDKAEIERLKKIIQAKPTAEQVNERMNTFYMVIGKSDSGVDCQNIERFMRRAKESNSLGLIGKFLSKDFAVPGAVAAAIEKRLETDSRNEYWPKGVSDEWVKRPKNERFIKFKTTAESEEWHNTSTSHTLTPPQVQLVESLKKMGTGGNAEDGLDRNKKPQIKY